MFGEKFKKASKNITVSKEVLSETREKMLREATKTHEKNYFAKAAVSFATIAAVICIGIFGTQLISPPDQPQTLQTGNNLLSISAYAYEQQEDGQLKQREINLSQEDAYTSEYIIAIRGGENNEYQLTQIKMLGFKCHGENISKVDFKIDNGVLKVPNESWAEEKLLKNLESKGKTLTIDYESGAPEEVYWESEPFTVKIETEEGRQANSESTETKDPMLIPEIAATITATVHFKDGSTAEKVIVYDSEKGTIKVEEVK